MTAPAAERCPTCDRPRAGEDAASHDDGCVCDLCLSVCWRSWGGQCTEVDWPTRGLAAEAWRAKVAPLIVELRQRMLGNVDGEAWEIIDKLVAIAATEPTP